MRFPKKSRNNQEKQVSVWGLNLHIIKSPISIFITPRTSSLGRSEGYIFLFILNRHEQRDIIHNSVCSPAFPCDHTGQQSLQELGLVVQHWGTLLHPELCTSAGSAALHISSSCALKTWNLHFLWRDLAQLWVRGVDFMKKTQADPSEHRRADIHNFIFEHLEEL